MRSFFPPLPICSSAPGLSSLPLGGWPLNCIIWAFLFHGFGQCEAPQIRKQERSIYIPAPNFPNYGFEVIVPWPKATAPVYQITRFPQHFTPLGPSARGGNGLPRWYLRVLHQHPLLASLSLPHFVKSLCVRLFSAISSFQDLADIRQVFLPCLLKWLVNIFSPFLNSLDKYLLSSYSVPDPVLFFEKTMMNKTKGIQLIKR